MIAGLSEKLLAWYDTNARDLPWRSAPTPYHTWISEIMLQQTQVDTVIPYFLRFINLFPEITSLAAANQADVLKAWEGLGYYNRAINLHKAAQQVCSQYQCSLPTDPKQLEQLPGIGRYTAGAIASIAFGVRAPALDANIRRVFARLLAWQEPLGTGRTETAFWEFAEAALPSERVGDYNQALMELGALVCKTRSPKCGDCPLRADCLAAIQHKQESIPVRKQKPQVPHYMVSAAVICDNGQVLIAQRPPNGLLAGLWEFPGGKLEPDDADLQACLKREILEELNVEVQVGEPMGVYRHAYTHFKVTLHAFACRLPSQTLIDERTHPNVRWVALEQLNQFAMGKVDGQIARHITAMGFCTKTKSRMQTAQSTE